MCIFAIDRFVIIRFSRTYPASYYKVSYAFGKSATLVEFLMIDTILLCGNTRDITEAGFIDMIFATVQKNPNMPKDPVAAKTQLDWIEQQLSSSRFCFESDILNFLIQTFCQRLKIVGNSTVAVLWSISKCRPCTFQYKIQNLLE